MLIVEDKKSKMDNLNTGQTNISMVDFLLNSSSTLYCRENQTVEQDILKFFTSFFEFYAEPTIFMIGIITNICNFITIRKMSISKVIKTLLCTVSITDFCTSVLGFLNIFLEIVIFKGDLIYGCWEPGILPLFITYKHYLMFLGMSSALFILTSIIRTYSILYPLEWGSTFTKRKTVKLIILVCVVIFLAFQPISLYSMWKGCFREQRFGIMSTQCAKLEKYHLISIGFYTRFYFGVIAILLGPGTTIGNIVCLILLKRAISKSLKHIMSFRREGSENDTINNQQLSKSMQVNKMFYAILIINTICITPSAIQVAALIINPEKYIFDKTPFVAIVDIVAETFLGILTAYNFFLYLVINKDFRKKFQKIVCCCIKPKYKAAGYANNDSVESWRRVSRKTRFNETVKMTLDDSTNDGLMMTTSV